MPLRTPPGASGRREKLEQLPDAELCELCAARDELAWSVLVSRYRKLVFAIPMRAGLSEEEVEDVFQSTYARLATRLGTIEQKDRVQAWIVTTARRLTIDAIRARQKHRERREETTELDRVEDPAELPSDAVMALERRHLVRLALSRLGERCSKLLQLLFYEREERSWESVADELGMPLGSVGPTRARCLAKLLKEYETLERME